MFAALKKIIHRTEPQISPKNDVLDKVSFEPTGAEDPTLIDANMSGWFKDDTGELLKGFYIDAADTVLDVGCGDGPFVHFCAQRGAEVIFADIDSEKVAAVERSLVNSKARAVVPIVSDANPLPLPDARADKIIAMEVLEHVANPQQFMGELMRVGKPGALYLITVPDKAGELVQKELAPAAYFEYPNHIRIFSREDFSNLITEAGLEIVERKYYGFYWSMWWFLFWACKQDMLDPWHPILLNWTKTWELLLKTEGGPKIKEVLDRTIPKSQAIIARKPM